jgi:hypothetical protein
MELSSGDLLLISSSRQVKRAGASLETLVGPGDLERKQGQSNRQDEEESGDSGGTRDKLPQK